MESKLFRLKRIKTQIWRFFPVFFLVLSLGLMALTKTENPVSVYAKRGSVSVLAPIVSVLSVPTSWVKDFVQNIHSLSSVYRENERLQAENQDLLKWRSLALELSEEQKELKEYLNYIPPSNTRHLLVKIAMDEGSAFTRSFIVSAGENQGVSKGMLAFSAKGLFARVVEVMPNHARVMAVTDYMSRVPVWVGKNKVPALLVGDNTARPYLQFLHENEVVHEGENVMTSGYVGVYPAGLLIGTVDTVREEEVRVRPLENGEKLSFVRLVDFSLASPLLKEVK